MRAIRRTKYICIYTYVYTHKKRNKIKEKVASKLFYHISVYFSHPRSFLIFFVSFSFFFHSLSCFFHSHFCHLSPHTLLSSLSLLIFLRRYVSRLPIITLNDNAGVTFKTLFYEICTSVRMKSPYVIASECSRGSTINTKQIPFLLPRNTTYGIFVLLFYLFLFLLLLLLIYSFLNSFPLSSYLLPPP